MDPSTGTFTTMDTYGGSLTDPMSLHKYLFANSNPVMYSDPSGHYTLTQQETAIAIQAIIGEAMSGIFYIADWLLTDPESQNHSIPMMIITMMIGLAQGAVMGSWGGLLTGLISKAGLSILDYLLTGIMFTLFSWDLKLAAMNMKESGNWLVAVLCDAGGDFAGVVALCSLSEGFSGIANWVKDKTNRMKPNKKGFVRIGGYEDVGAQVDNESLSWTPHGYKHFPNKNQTWKEVVKSTESGPAKYSFDITDVESFEREAWASGIPVTNGKNWKVYKCDSVVGAVNGQETIYVRIENSANTIHGHPISENEYIKLLSGH